jgi:ADP-ribose pyrophosphatase YjhB (NUDIX family)
MINPIHKVTCFITRNGNQGIELLLFFHPNAGIQVPAGTDNLGEEPETAARREAAEETGLKGLFLLRSLGEVHDPAPDGYLLVAYPTPVYSRPDSSSFDWAHLDNLPPLISPQDRWVRWLTDIS